MLPFVSMLARPFLGKLPLPDAARAKLDAVSQLLAGGTGDEWIKIGRAQSTLPFAGERGAAAASVSRGTIGQGDGAVGWVQFDWPADLGIDDCVLNRVRWRFYANGLVCLEVVASKDSGGIDTSDLIGHSVELRDTSGFLIGVWSAAFLVHRGTDRLTFQSAVVDDFLPLKLHFDEIADHQDGVAFRI